MTRLDIVASLDAADELGNAAIKIIVGNIQAAVRPSSAEVGADIKSGPVVGRRCDWSVADGGLGGQIGCQRRRANNSRTAMPARKIVFTSAPKPSRKPASQGR
jgi:hypothetical protein